MNRKLLLATGIIFLVLFIPLAEGKLNIFSNTGKGINKQNNVGNFESTIPISMKHGWPVQRDARSVTPVDLDNNGKKEIVILSDDGPDRNRCWIGVYNLRGNLLSGWPKDICDTIEGFKDPSFGDLDGDGKLEIILVPVAQEDPKIYVFRKDGSPLPGWPVTLYGKYLQQAVLSDMDSLPGDEIVLLNRDKWGWNFLHVIDKNGNDLPGFPVNLGKDFTFHTKPAVGDIDKDGSLDIVLAYAYGTADKTYVYVYDNQGALLPGWPFIADATTWQGYPRAISLGDLEGKGDLEIVIATRERILVIDNTPKLLKGWESVYVDYSWEIALGDLDMDGDLEIFAAGDQSGLLYAFEHDGSLIQGWPFYTGHYNPYTTHATIGAIGSLDGKGVVVASTMNQIFVLDQNGQPLPWANPLGFTDFILGKHLFFCSIEDLEGDGKLEIIGALPQDFNMGEVYIWEYLGRGKMEWKMQASDPQRTGSY
jgi:hypothetical protein